MTNMYISMLWAWVNTLDNHTFSKYVKELEEEIRKEKDRRGLK